MRQSTLFPHTKKNAPADETSVNARVLEQAGFIQKLMAGVYSYLPLGLRVLQKIENIIREEMNKLGAQEVFLPALQPKELWNTTGRWEGLREVMYQFKDHSDKPIGLAITHEEVIADLLRHHIRSYKDLPVALYQIQTKFRHELRPKSGLNRGREFAMKDLYSAHVSQEDCNVYYEEAKSAYTTIFERLGIPAKVVEASGGDFSKEFSHEFQVLTDVGEDHILSCPKCSFAQNKEIAKVQKGDTCPACKKGTIEESRGIEVGNIFKLGTKYTSALKANFVDETGKQQPIVMASYGIGPSRCMGTIVELHHDDKGIVWPQSVAPFVVHLLHIGKEGASIKQAEEAYAILQEKGIDVLFDDRTASPGEKFHDADLLGIPHRVIISEKTGTACEYRTRENPAAKQMMLKEILKRIKTEKTALI